MRVFTTQQLDGLVGITGSENRELVEKFVYDELGRRIQTINGAGEATETQYDDDNNIIRTRDNRSFDGGANDNYSYFDNLRHQTQSIDANNNSLA